MTLLEAPWRNVKTERAGKDWKEDYYKTTQDSPEAQTWTDFEEDCDAVNQARAPKINDSGNSAYQSVFGRDPPQIEDAILECGGADLRVVSRQTNRRTDTGTVDDCATPCPPSKFSLGPHTSLETSPAPRCETLQGRTACWSTSLILATWSECSQETNQRFLAPRRGHQKHVGHSLDCPPRFVCQVCTIPGATVSRRLRGSTRTRHGTHEGPGRTITT